MNDRKKREARKARVAAAQAVKPLPSHVPAQRGTFRVAEAQRQLAAELPSIVRTRQQASKPSLSRAAVVDPMSMADQGEAKPSPRRAVDLARPDQPKLDKGDLHLKCRPKSNKPSSGGGSGRNFVLWRKC